MILPILVAIALQTAPEAAAAPASDAAAGAWAPAKPAAPDASDIPHGAPTDDFGFVSWCRGALSGHMELYPAVKPEMQKVEAEKAEREDARFKTDAEREAAVKRRTKEAVEDTKLDEEQLAAGRTYLKLYTDAITAAEGASAANLRAKSEEAQDAGYRIWSAARGAEPRTKMWSWVMWELPARCETAAHRLIDRSSILAGALKPQVEARADVNAPAGGVTTAAADAAPAPDVKSADTASADLPKADEAKPEAAAAEVPKAADPVPSQAPVADPSAPGAPPPADSPVSRRPATAPPSDAPDAPSSEPKP